MQEQSKEFILRALRNSIGDDLIRARMAFNGMSAKEMQAEHGQSGKTRQQILDEYQEHDTQAHQALTDFKAYVKHPA